MKRYEIRCTPEQTRKALALGAPIMTFGYPDLGDYEEEILKMNRQAKLYATEDGGIIVGMIPTAEQMIGFLEGQHSLQFLTGVDDEDKFFFNVYHTEGYIEVRGCDSRKEATLAAIDAALEYLSKNKK